MCTCSADLGQAMNWVVQARVEVCRQHAGHPRGQIQGQPRSPGCSLLRLPGRDTVIHQFVCCCKERCFCRPEWRSPGSTPGTPQGPFRTSPSPLGAAYRTPPAKSPQAGEELKPSVWAGSNALKLRQAILKKVGSAVIVAVTMQCSFALLLDQYVA